MPAHDARRGARIYSKPVLGFYDALVVKFSNSTAWRCPSETMLARYDELIGARHLEVGPGTGWYLANAEIPDGTEMHLADLNSNTLEMTASRLAEQHAVTRHELNVLEPLSPRLGRFDSIGLNYVMHCVPGSWGTKGRAFGHLAERLADDGVLFGGTILGAVEHNATGRALMALYNRLGIFHNRADDVEGLHAALDAAFNQVELRVVGTVALFTARAPRR